MIQAHLNRAIAKATGDDCHLISRLGFTLVNDESPVTDDDLEALVQDWDNIQAELSSTEIHSEFENVPMRHFPTVRSIKISKKDLRRTGPRRRVETAH